MTTRQADISIEARIQERYADLAASERPLADMLLSFPGQVASYSATELATMAGVSKAAASRLVKKLGFETYEDLRRQARASQSWGSPQYTNSAALEGRPFDDAVQAHIACETENIRATLSGLTSSLDEAVAALVTAPRVACLGFRRSRIVADYLRWSLIQIRRDVHVLPTAGETLSEWVSEFHEGDVVVAVGLRRRVPLLASVLEQLEKKGIRTLLIADPSAGALARRATWFVPCETRTSSPFDSDIAALSVAHFVSSRLAGALGDSARKRMQAVERTLLDLRELET